MSDEFYVVSLVALLDAVHAYGIAVCGVAGVASEGKYITLGTNRKLTG